MGYTHYWRVKRDISPRVWSRISADVIRLIMATPVPIRYEFDQPGKMPEVSPDTIRFNGVGVDGYETFLIDRTRDSDNTFCKTDRRPYDLMVCAVLIVVNHYAPKKTVEITSDGGMEGTVPDYAGPHDKEWDDALAFVRKVLGDKYELPPLITHRRGAK